MSQDAIVLHSLSFNSSVLETRSIPIPGPDDLLVKVFVAGVNPHDAKAIAYGMFITELLKTPSGAILASDVVGEVISLGSNVTDFSIGQRVVSQSSFITTPDKGGLQQYCLLEAKYTAVVPEAVPNDEAATVPINGFAAWAAMFALEGLMLPPPGTQEAKTFPYPKESILIVGGGANTGKFATQFARLAGFGKIVVVAGASASTVAHLKKLGASHVVDRHGKDQEVVARIREIVGDSLLYAVDMASPRGEYNVAISSLSNTKHGKVIWVTGGPDIPPTMYPEKKAGFSGKHIMAGSSLLTAGRGELFWKELPGMLDRKELVPIENGWAKIIKGLDVAAVDEGIEALGNGKTGRFHVHPNAALL